MLMMDMTKKVLWHRPKNDESYLKKTCFLSYLENVLTDFDDVHPIYDKW